MIRMMMRLERALAKNIMAIKKKQIREMAKVVKKGNLALIDWAVDQHAPALTRTLNVYYTRTISAFGGLVFNEVQKSPSFMLEVKGPMEERYWWRMRRWIRQESLNKAQGINYTMKKETRRLIDRGLRREEYDEFVDAVVAKPMSYTELSKSITDTLAKVAWQALRIARTEVHTAAVMSTQEATKTAGEEFGIVWGKYWLAANDERTRESHAAAGERYSEENPISMDAKYEIGREDGGVDMLSFPGDPSGSPGTIINCRCVELYKELPRAVQQGTGQMVEAEV